MKLGVPAGLISMFALLPWNRRLLRKAGNGTTFAARRRQAKDPISMFPSASSGCPAWTRKVSTVSESDTRVLAWNYLWDRVLRGLLPANLEVWHEGKCGRCGRKLTVPESIERGIGPECERLMAA